MDETSVSFQMFLILSFIALTWFRKPNFCIQAMSKQYSYVWFFLVFFFFGGGGGMRIARFNFSRLSLSFILKYYPILHVVKR